MQQVTKAGYIWRGVYCPRQATPEPAKPIKGQPMPPKLPPRPPRPIKREAQR